MRAGTIETYPYAPEMKLSCVDLKEQQLSPCKMIMLLFSVTWCSNSAVPHWHTKTLSFCVVLLYPYIVLILFPFACTSLCLLDLPDLSTQTETVSTKVCSDTVCVPNSALICSVWNTPFLMYVQTVTEVSKTAWYGLLHYVKHSI